MVSLEQLDPHHRWVAHHFDCMARDRFKWCVKGIGVQELFGDRKGALRIIGNYFDSVTLHLRSLPDRCLYGNKGRFWLIEIKAFEDRPNVALEAYQLCYLRVHQDQFNAETLYVFGEPDERGDLEARICPVHKLPVERFFETRRFREVWSESLRSSLHDLRKLYYPHIPLTYTDSEVGSGDPFIIFSKTSLLKVSKPLLDWFEEQGIQTLTPKERIAWEGRDYQGTWRKYPPKTSWGKYQPT